MTMAKYRSGPERQRRYLKASMIKFNRKLDRLGQKAVEPKTFSNLMIEGNALLVFASIDAMNRTEDGMQI